MAFDRPERLFRRLVGLADVQVEGERPWDIVVRDPRFYRRVISHGVLGLGESYMDGWWECHQIDELVCRLVRARLARHVRRDLPTLTLIAAERLFNRQRIGRAGEVGERHYDLGNDLFTAMLDSRMVYSCAYWDGAETLDEAQERKLELSCEKLDLKPGMRVLDIGCGWGSFARFAAENYDVEVVGVNNSKEQLDLGRTLCAGLPVELRFEDYRQVTGSFDRVVSIGMFEHVGPKNYRAFMEVANRCLSESGLFLLHTIGSNTTTYHIDPWTQKYIFPRAVLPSVTQIGAACEGVFVMEDWHNLSVNYEKTLLAWYANFDSAWDRLSSRYDERFYRMWKFYLLSCAGSFRARHMQVWQIVLSKQGVVGGYRLRS